MYELDLVKNIFPEANIIGLRKPNYSIDEWEEIRLSVYDSFLKFENKLPNDLRKIIVSSESLNKTEEELRKENNRFCELLFWEIVKAKINSSYLISITGSSHIEKPNVDSMKDTFEYFGFFPEIIYLNQSIDCDN